MKLTPEKRQEVLSATITQTLIVILACSLVIGLSATGAPPAWWSSRGAVAAPVVTTNNGVVTTNYAPDDNAAATEGQLKQFTVNAVGELNADLTNFGGAGPALTNLVYGWRQDYATNGYSSTNIKPSDYAAMNVGQLKTMAGMVYGRLAAAGYPELTPTWLHQNTNTDNIAANLGQLKQVFDFDLSLPGASNLTATPDGSGTINLSWSLPSTNNVSSWLVEEQNSDGSWTVINTLTNSATDSYSVTGLANGQSYTFQVVGSGTKSVSVPARVSATLSGPPIGGLKLWLKADAGVTKDGSGNVSAWIDQTGNYTVTQSGSSMPTYLTSDLNGKPALHFNGSQWLYNSGTMSGVNADLTMITVANTSNPSALEENLFLGNGSTYQNRGIGYFQSRQLFDSYVEYALGNSTPTANMYVTEEFSLNSSLNTATFYRDGAQTASVSVSGIGSVTSGITVGAPTDQYAPWQGNIAEVLVYDHQLSSAELAQVDGYLSDKYGLYSLNATWLLVYSSDVQALITANQWNESQANAYVAAQAAFAAAETAFAADNPRMVTNGLTVWLKADSGVTANASGNISKWTDLTPYQNDANQTNSGDQPTLITSTTGLNGKPVLRFDGGSSYLTITDNPSLWPSSAVTIIALAQTYGSGQQDVVDRSLNYGAYGDYWNAPQYSYELGTDSNNVERGYLGTSGGADLAGSTARALRMSIATMVYDGSHQSLYDSGVEQASAAVTGAIDYNNPNEHDLYLGVHNGYFGLGGYFNGDLAEVLIYNRALTTAEQQQAEGYLADKYGVYDTNATWPLTYGSDVQALITANEWSKAQADAYVTFAAAGQPVATSGLIAWLKADSGVTADGSGKVSAWADQTVFGNNATQGNAANQPTLITGTTGLNSKPVIEFNGSNSYLSIKDNPSLWPSSAVTIIALAQTYSNQQQDVVDRTLNYGSYGDYWNAPQYSYDLGINNDNVERGYIGTSGGSDLSGSAGRPYQMSISAMVYDGSQQVLYDSGVEQASVEVSGTIDYNNPTEHDLYLGVNNGYFGLGGYFNGDLAEVLIYNRALTTAEQQQAEGYLADKYGVYDTGATWPSSYSSDIQALIMANGWSKAQADAYVAFASGSPAVPASGLALWMEADAGVTADGSGNVSHWVDQGPDGHVAAQPTSGSQPQLVTDPQTGHPSISFAGSQSLSSRDYIAANQDVTIIAAAAQSNSGAICAIGLNPSITGSMRGYGYFSGQAQFDVYQNSVTAGVAPPMAIPEVSTMTYARSSGALQFFLKGISTGTANISVTDIVPGFSLGVEGWQGGYLTGNISEVLVYNRVLSSAEQQQVEVYLADKYGLYHPDATWPLAYSSAVQAEILLHQWNKLQADNYVALQTNNTNLPTNGLSLWLRADAGVTATSGNVTAIADQTGNYVLDQSTTANQPTLVASDINGLPALRFNGTQWLAAPGTLAPGLNQDMTIITVGMTTNPDAQTYSIYLGQNNGTQGVNRAVGYYGSELLDTAGSSCVGGQAPLAGTFVAETATLDSTLTNVTFYQNGLQTATGSLSGVQNLSAGITLGAAGGGSNGWQGDIAEVLVYDHKLSPTELQQVGVYLADKYGLYANEAPVVSPAGGSFSSTQTVTITSGLTIGSLHYTLDGTEPTASSPTYTTAISLGSSALVSAAVFIDGNLASPVATAQFYINDPDETGLPPAPTGLTVTSVSGNQIDLGWSLATLQTYGQVYVYRSTNGGAYQLIAVLSATSTAFDDRSVTAGDSYTYEIGTGNQAGISTTSASSSESPTTPTPLSIIVTTPSGAVPLP
jgi:hypothetical protein